MTKYYINETDGDMYRMNEKRIGLLLYEMWQDVRNDNITLIRFPDGLSDDDLENNRQGFDYAVYMHGKDSKGFAIVIRYYVSICEDGCFSTTPIELSYSIFITDLLAYEDTLNIEDAKTGEVLKSFTIRRGA